MVKIRRLAVGAVALVAATGLTLTGCGTGTGGGGGDTPDTPKEVVLAAAKKLDNTTFTMKISSDAMHGQLKVDMAHQKAAMDAQVAMEGVSGKISMIVIDQDIYVKIDFSDLLSGLGDLGSLGGMGGGPELDVIQGKTWVHMDDSDLDTPTPGASGSDAGGLLGSLGLGDNPADSMNPDAMLNGITDVTKIDDKHYTATIDPSKVNGDSLFSAFGTFGDSSDSAPASAGPIKVDITLDDQGRIAELKMTATVGDKSETVDIAFSDFGEPVDVSKPTNVIESSEVPDFFDS